MEKRFLDLKIINDEKETKTRTITKCSKKIINFLITVTLKQFKKAYAILILYFEEKMTFKKLFIYFYFKEINVS